MFRLEAEHKFRIMRDHTLRLVDDYESYSPIEPDFIPQVLPGDHVHHEEITKLLERNGNQEQGRRFQCSLP